MIEARIAIPGETKPRLGMTAESIDLLRSLWRTHGPLMFHQSGGCCDGSSPMCFAAGEFLTGGSDVLLGVFDIAPAGHPEQLIEFWMSGEQFAYWSHTYLTVDVVAGRGSGFSLEAPEGVRFLIRSTLMETAEPFS